MYGENFLDAFRQNYSKTPTVEQVAPSSNAAHLYS
jgi:hypothetical protein